LWFDRCKRAAALVCGLFFLNFSGSVLAASTSKKPVAVNAVQKAKKVTPKAGSNKNTKIKKTPVKARSDNKRRVATKKAVPNIGMAEMRMEERSGLRGSASFYGHGFQGRRSASGERFDVRAFTAASNHFPLGSWVAVQRLDNGRCAIVKVNDRMHTKHQRRIIDVSRSVASYLDMIRAGVVMVRVAPLKSIERAAKHCRAAFEETDSCPECRPGMGLSPDLRSIRDFPLP